MKTKDQIQKLAKLLVNFRKHLAIFVTVNAILWIAWLLKGSDDFNSILIYISVTWSAILIIHYFIAYEIFNTTKKDKHE